MSRDTAKLSEQIELACLIEATARKPGNVHPGASFDDLNYDDFVTAARIAAPILAEAEHRGVGRSILEAVRATASATGTNVNLGICLLIAPLAAVPGNVPLNSGVRSVLQQLTVEDAKLVYEAIRLSKPGGLGEAPTQDVRDEPTQTLWAVMKLAAERDGIAAEYAKEFRLSYLTAVAWLKKFLHDVRPLDGMADEAGREPLLLPWEYATIGVQLSLLMVQSDTLIRRKCGDAVFHEAACRAEFLMKSNFQPNSSTWKLMADFDAWLRGDGHRRNPGTTADLIAAIWFIAIREGMIVPPTKAEILDHAARIQNTV